MKKPIIIELIIWIFILTLVFTGLIFGYSKLFVEPNVYTIHFKDVDGITKGSPVKFMGINIGHVRKLTAKDKRIDVQIIVTKKGVMIPNGTIAKVEFFGLGGSKSIELLPPDGSCDVGILTGETIRLADVAKEATSLVEVAETIEKYVKGLSQTGMKHFLDTIIDLKDEKITSQTEHINNIKEEINHKTKIIKEKQRHMNEKIDEINSNVEKINKFIKK